MGTPTTRPASVPRKFAIPTASHVGVWPDRLPAGAVAVARVEPEGGQSTVERGSGLGAKGRGARRVVLPSTAGTLGLGPVSGTTKGDPCDITGLEASIAGSSCGPLAADIVSMERAADRKGFSPAEAGFGSAGAEVAV